MATKLYVGGLAYSVTEQELEAKFAEVGKVVSAVVIKDRDTNQSKGFGFVEMEDADEASSAIKTLDKPILMVVQSWLTKLAHKNRVPVAAVSANHTRNRTIQINY